MESKATVLLLLVHTLLYIAKKLLTNKKHNIVHTMISRRCKGQYNNSAYPFIHAEKIKTKSSNKSKWQYFSVRDKPVYFRCQMCKIWWFTKPAQETQHTLHLKCTAIFSGPFDCHHTKAEWAACNQNTHSTDEMSHHIFKWGRKHSGALSW